MTNKITTYTNKRMNPLNASLDDIEIEDIAHALSLMTRGNGHVKYFFSVAQHSINCFKEARARGYSIDVQLASLLHDASESYLSDITRPVKRELNLYREIENKLQSLIYYKYFGRDLTQEEKDQVLDVDNAMLVVELDKLLDTQIESDTHLVIEPDLDFKEMNDVKYEFLEIYKRLNNQIK